MKETKQTIVTVSDLAPSTLYCVKVQAFSEAYNKSSDFSREECIGTAGGRMNLRLVTPIKLKLLTVHGPLRSSLVRKYLQHGIRALPSQHMCTQRSYQQSATAAVFCAVAVLIRLLF